MNDLMEAVYAEAFGTGLSQHARLISLESAQGSELPESLMAERFTAREAVNDLFVFDIDALSVSASMRLRAAKSGMPGTSWTTA